ncbi:hypothetical protein BCR33DRAFT_249755 [Rhizoclosmatium globosum]|uniref:Uncharacterized protein n=1 Tax=Rhizoclosmatium globosum TaxID=329046 RepID=A0A1Y2C9T9_9FUNG|nr:hypothetical protein BCR33DRAFT_249755 [Rhizoclosmatium globosum]|eukprot:ORY43800.1 hypothetical protein BCR33DRAFT_249755 [Rhizoclosmatium globosum]
MIDLLCFFLFWKSDNSFENQALPMLIQCPSITTDQVKVAILPLVFQREASLVGDNPQEPVEKVGDTRRDSFLRRGSLFGSPAVAQPPEKLKKHEIDPSHLKGTELWPLEEGQGGNSADRDIGAGWVPIYVSFCSLTDNLLYEDNRYVIITDHHIHVTKPILWERKVDFQHAFEHSIRIDRIIYAKAEVRRCHTFHAPFQHLVIKHKEMSLIKPPGVRMPLRHYSVCNTVGNCKPILGTAVLNSK